MIKKLFIVFLLLSCESIFAAKLPTLVVMLDWFANPDHAPLFVAEQEGFFAGRGIKVEFISPADASEGEKMVAANKADIALTYQPAFMYHITHGLPLVRFATLINTPLYCVVVLKDGPIYTLKDLKGKRLVYSPTGTNNVMLSVMLKNVGLNVDDIKLMGIKFNLTQALLSGKADGFIGGMRNFEPIVMESAGKSVRMFYPEEYGYPMYDELILVTNKNKIKSPLLVRFVEGLQQGIDYLQDHPEESWQKFAKNHPELNNAFNKKAWFFEFVIFCQESCKIR